MAIDRRARRPRTSVAVAPEVGDPIAPPESEVAGGGRADWEASGWEAAPVEGGPAFSGDVIPPPAGIETIEADGSTTYREPPLDSGPLPHSDMEAQGRTVLEQQLGQAVQRAVTDRLLSLALPDHLEPEATAQELVAVTSLSRTVRGLPAPGRNEGDEG